MANGDDRLSHLLVVGRVDAEEFRRRGGGAAKKRPAVRQSHGQRLAGEARSALDEQEQDRQQVTEEQLRAIGSIIVVEGAEAVYPLKLESLDHAGRDEWLLLSVHVTGDGAEHAIVWVADRHRDKFLKLFDDYLNSETPTGKPRNEGLVANIGRIRSSLLRDLWQSDGEPPQQGLHWWEIWLRRDEDAADLLSQFAAASQLQVAPEQMELDQRIIVWVRASWSQLTVLPATAVPIAEIRRAQFVDTLADLPLDEQQQLVEDLADRLQPSAPTSPSVCLLDTGVRRSHVLLDSSLADVDCHSIVAGGPVDTKGHGTSMAGLALLGRVDPSLLSSGPVQLTHRLDSVKMLPDTGPGHDPKTYGLVTAQAVSAPETIASRRRALCMPITAPPERSEQPSLWSASVDALAVGTDIGANDAGVELLGAPNLTAARLFVISTGNVVVQGPPADYLDVCDASIIEDPAQAWNALVVGAYTELVDTPTDPSFSGWSALASTGELSPHSRTGVLMSTQWPIRPDICMEGGNVLFNGSDLNYNHPIITLPTTGHRDDIALTTANATSAATAQASRLAARAMSIYPDYWPETIRGLVVHGAEWTPAMRAQIETAGSIVEKRAVLGRYGWGVPTEQSVLTSGLQAVTMVVQDEFVPFTGPDYTMRQFRLHHLPWPVDVLQELGGADVRLKVTLSYFIEPSAPRRGWRNRYAYASHGLRFELKNTTENVNEFISRVNREAGTEEGGGAAQSGTDRWLIGPRTRNSGSLHQDIWTGTGPELAECGVLAVHPVGGWWKNGKRTDRRELPVRYALIVSLSTQQQDVDLYTPIATELEVEIDAVEIQI